LISKDTGEKLMTSIPMHLDFIRKRKAATEKHYAQVVRLLKFWCKLQKEADPEGFRFKSFMVELIVAYLADRGTPLDDYPEALAQIFAYLGWGMSSARPSPSRTTTTRAPAKRPPRPSVSGTR
jgi:hypothetical protein